MAWTAPRTWVASELVTASIMNSAVRDNLSYLKNAPTFDGLVTAAAGIASQGTSTPASGSGLELLGGASPAIQSFNRTGGAYLAIVVDALNHKWKTSNTERWGINAAGDFTVGSSTHIADSVGTPTITVSVPAGFKNGTVVGTDYAMLITNGSGTNTSGGAITFGHTWSTAPVCVALGDINPSDITSITTTTTQLTLSVGNTAGTKYFVLCRGY